MRKTTLLAVAMAACLGYAPAQAAEVVSSNIVGYEKVSLSTGLNMIGVQFKQVGGEDLILANYGALDPSMAGFDEDELFATEMLLWTGNGYTTYGWSGTSGTDVYDDETYDNQWLDANSMEPADTIAAAASLGAWIRAEKSGTLTVSGEVPTAATVEKSLTAGLNMIANPYPGDVTISKFGTLDASMAGFDEDELFATEMLVWNGNGYTTYGWSGTSGTDVYDDDSYDNQWLDANSMEPATSVTVPFGHAVWIKAEKAGTITFKNPTASAD